MIAFYMYQSKSKSLIPNKVLELATKFEHGGELLLPTVGTV